MVAIRKRGDSSRSNAVTGAEGMKRDDHSGITAPQEDRQELASAERGGGEGSSSTAAPAPASAPTEQDELKKRLLDQQRAEQMQEHYRQQQAQIARTFQGDPAKPNPTPQQEAIAQAQKEVQDWVAQRPGIINDPQAIATGTRLVHLGFVLGSPAWRNAMEQQGFGPRDYTKLQQHQHQPLARASEPASDSEQRAVETAERDESARHVSAPVSRDGPSYTGDRQRNLSPSSVRLSADELAIAKASGQTPVEYARAKLKLAEMKRAGLISDQ